MSMESENRIDFATLPPHRVGLEPEADTSVLRRVAIGLRRKISVKEINPELSAKDRSRYCEALRRLKDRMPCTAFISEATLSRN
jgi:hypothetical protein